MGTDARFANPAMNARQPPTALPALTPGICRGVCCAFESGRRVRLARIQSLVGLRLVVAITAASGDATRAADGVKKLEDGRGGEGADFFASVAYVPKPEDDRKLPFNLSHKPPRPAELPRPRQRRQLRNRQLPHSRENPVPSLAASIRDLAPGDSVGAVLDQNVHRLGRFDVARIISELGQMKVSGRAAEVFRWLQKGDSRLFPDDRALCSVIEVMVQAGEVKSACELAESAQENPGLVFQTLAIALAEAGNFEAALKVLDRREVEAMDFDVGPVLAKLIVEASRLGFRNLIPYLLEKLDAQDLHLDLEDSSAVMAACSKMGLPETAETFFQRFQQRGLQPNVVMYTTLISTRARANKYREAAAVVWEMEDANCPLDLMGYRVVMKVLGEVEDLPMAAKMYNRMKSDGFSPTLDIYDVIIKLHCKNGRWGKAKDVLKDMEMKGCPPSERMKAYFTA